MSGLINEFQDSVIEKKSRQFEALFNYATIGIVITTQDGKVINFNRYAADQFGYSPQEVIGNSVEMLIPSEFHSRHIGYRNDFMQHPQTRPMGKGRELHAQRKDGSQFPVEVSLSHYQIDHEVFVIAFVIDITLRKIDEEIMLEQKKHLEEFNNRIQQLNADLEQKVEDRTKMLRETLDELERSRKELSEAYEKEKELSDLKLGFVTMASHEFKTPLSIILSSVSLISRYKLNHEQDKREKHLGRIRGAVLDMKNILEDFLSMEKLDEESMVANLISVPAAEFIKQIKGVIDDIGYIVKPGQEIITELEIHQNVVLDPALFRIIITNLITNAIKFSPENAKIYIRSSLAGELVWTICDPGIGISAEDQVHLFQRFFRAKNAEAIQGTGVGLYLVGRYIQLMGGRIEVKSELNQGTSVCVFIPQS